MSGGDQETDPDTPSVDAPQRGSGHPVLPPHSPPPGDHVITGEAVPPDEHTLRVRARDKSKQEGSSLKVHDERPPELEPEPRSSTEMADLSRRRQKRERDRRAERRAMQMVFLLFLGLGGGAFALVNFMIEEDPPSIPTPADPDQQNVVPPPPPPTGVISTKIDETPAIPALQHLRETGLTIAAEGIPQVDAVEGETGTAPLAVLETCRFSYAVWEFSPNKRFRFMSTCGALDGQVMFGAYEIDGAVIRMSPLVTDTDTVISEFFVERPSKMVTRVKRDQSGPIILEIMQKVTSMRPGLDGEAWRDAFADRNTIHLPGEHPKTAPPPSAPPAPKKGGGDPLLDLLKNQDG